MPQITSDTKIHSQLIDIRLKRLKRKTIIMEDGILKLHPIIEKYFKNKIPKKTDGRSNIFML